MMGGLMIDRFIKCRSRIADIGAGRAHGGAQQRELLPLGACPETAMKQHTLCVHRLPEIASLDLSDYHVVAQTSTRPELRTALSSVKPGVLVLDLDDEETSFSIVEALEVLPDLCVIGATDQRDPQVIIAALRAGCRQVTTKPIDPNDLIVAIRRALNKGNDKQQTSKTVGVMGMIGGAGATTAACHLALAMARITSANTLLVDLDLEFGGVARAFDLEPNYTIADIAGAGAIDAVLLQRAAAAVRDGLSILSHPRTIEECHALDETQLSKVICTAKRTYPFIVLDLPRHLDAITGAGIEKCDSLLLVTQLMVPAITNTRRVMETLERAGIPSEKIEVIVNRYSKNTHSVTLDMVEDTLHRKPYGIVPNDFNAVSNAIDLGQPIDTRSPVYKAVLQVANKLMGLEEEGSRGGWLARLKLGRTPEKGSTSSSD
jgi:pilus assembly protein CpaE